MIDAAGVKKAFGSRVILRGVDVRVESGETFVLMGGSGSGKSTFLKCAIGLVRPDEGSIIVDKMDITKLRDEESIAQYRRKFGYVFQEGALFDSMTVADNVSFGLRYLRHDIPESNYREIATDKLALVGLQGIEDMKPSELSGGMKKRVALARAIAAEPDYILYDEPTTGLDPIMSDIISDLIIDLKTKLGVTSIVVTHDMKSAFKIADRIAMIYEGKILQVGHPDVLKITNNERVRQFIEGHSEGPIKMKLKEYD